jgi:hypothetical protein
VNEVEAGLKIKGVVGRMIMTNSQLPRMRDIGAYSARDLQETPS